MNPNLNLYVALAGQTPQSGDKPLASLMAWPNPGEETERERDLAVRLLDAGGKAALPRPMLEALVDLDLAKVRKQGATRELRGQTAGDLLLRVYFLSRQRPHQASQEKAMRLYAREMDGAFVSNGQRLALSRKSMRNAWDELLPAVHLWAAWRLWYGAHGMAAAPLFDHLISVAEAFRRWAETYHAPIGATGTNASRFPLIEPGRLWWMPPDRLWVDITLDEVTEHLMPGPKFAEWVATTPA